MEVCLGPGNIVLDGDPAFPHSPKKWHSPQFSAYVCCGQTAGWIKMALGTEVSFGPGHVVLDGDPAPPEKGAQQPFHFSAQVDCGQKDGWIRISLDVEVGLGPGHIVLDGDSAPQRKGAQQPSATFRPMSIVAKRSPISATAELLNSCNLPNCIWRLRCGNSV